MKRDGARTPDVPMQGTLQAFGLAYAWAGFAIMWGFWVSFVVFLASPNPLRSWWPLPTVDEGGFVESPALAAIINLILVSLFGVQHSLMARPWFKAWWAASIPPAFERCTYVHMANLTLFALIVFWQPIPIIVWDLSWEPLRHAVWLVFALGWIILYAGGRSFGMIELLGVDQMRRWANGDAPRQPDLKTGQLYKWIRHPMYVGVLLGVWTTPTMTLGHVMLAAGFTLYVLIAMRYEERDLLQRFGRSYDRWRAQTQT